MRTINVDNSDYYKVFLKYIPEKGKILDIGCGSGRDAYHFKQMGYVVEAIDGGKEFCHFASNLLGQPVECKMFQDIDYLEEFDGVWALASIHHLDRNELEMVLEKIYKALKVGGVLFFNARFGENEYDNKFGKHFNEFTQKSFKNFIKGNNILKNFKFKDEFVAGDKREGREEQWYCAVLKK